MNLLEVLESYQFLLSGHGRKYADDWLETIGTDNAIVPFIRASFDDNGVAQTLQWGSKTFTFHG